MLVILSSESLCIKSKQYIEQNKTEQTEQKLNSTARYLRSRPTAMLRGEKSTYGRVSHSEYDGQCRRIENRKTLAQTYGLDQTPSVRRTFQILHTYYAVYVFILPSSLSTKYQNSVSANTLEYRII